MFGKDFYPTPDNVIERMLANVNMNDKVKQGNSVN